jgi:carbon-monoxide dehydrogenase medium subunit
MKNFRYFSPRNLNEVLSLFDGLHKNIYIMAGGTDLLVRMKNREINVDGIIDLKRIPHLNYIEYDDKSGLKIGACSSIADVQKNPHLLAQYGALVEAASSIGSVQIRNKGTIGGNLCNASPAADLAPPLIVMDATVRIFGKAGERVVRLEDFFLGPGKPILQEGEILTEVQVPKLRPASGATYLKFSRRGGLDLAIVGVACLLVVNNDSRCELARIAMGAVAPTPVRAKKAEILMTGEKINNELIEEVSKIAAEEAKPISDIRASADYRREIVKVLVNRCIRKSMKR